MRSDIPGPSHSHAPALQAAIANILSNRDDANEGTFCYRLFESGWFDEALFVRLVDDLRAVSADTRARASHRATMQWIMLGALRCVFSHFDANDGYRITNLDESLYSRWSGDYFERLRELMA